MSNTQGRITDRRRQAYAVKLTREIVARVGQRGAARRIQRTSADVAWIIKEGTTPRERKETDRIKWTHVTLTELLIAQIEIAHTCVTLDADMSDAERAHSDRAIELLAELDRELRAMRRARRNRK